MAIVQISRIQQRKGLQIDLPQLAGGEMGWTVDERRLYIGNGTLTEGAPVIGNTEILTEFSDILEFASTYTYQGAAAGYVVQTGPTATAPITQSLQSRLDDFAVITDFGAVGDGVTDCTDAINRALFQLYCRQTNPQIRRSLFFPAGVYVVTESILIPPYAFLYGEGAQSSVIKLDVASDISTLNAYVARTADSLQQYGANIGTNGSTAPTDVTIENMGFESLQVTDIFLVDQASNCNFNNVSFTGPITTTQIVDPLQRGDIAGVRFNSTASLITTNINFSECQFSNCTYGVYTGELMRDAAFTDCEFHRLYQGVYLGGPTLDSAIGGPKGCAILHSTFDIIYEEGIVFDGVNLNISGYNTFYDVATHFGGDLGTPFAPVINIYSDNNVSVGDMFVRTDAASLLFPRVDLHGTANYTLENGSYMRVGQYQREAGAVVNTSGSAVTETLFQVDTAQTKAFRIDYTFIRDTAKRYGTMIIATGPGISTNDDFTENTSTGLTLTATQATNIVTVAYSTTAGSNGLFYYSITYLD